MTSLLSTLALASSLALPSSAPGGTPLQVLSHTPPANATFAPTAAPITVLFDQDVAVGSVGADAVRVFGRWSGPMDGAVAVGGPQLTFTPARPFFPGEQVTVNVDADLAASGGGALAGGYAFSFWTRASAGDAVFELVGNHELKLGGETFVQAYGIHAVDLDQDGDPDFSIPCEISSDVRVMENTGCGTFAGPTLHALPGGSYPSSNETGDFDGDGDPDLATANIVGDTVSVLLGAAGAAYEPATTYPSGDAPRAMVVLDANADARDDLVVACLNSSNLWLYTGQGDGTFAAPTTFEGGGNGEAALAAVDANGDGRWDLYCGHRLTQTATCLLGDATGTFAVSGQSPIGGQAWMLASGDVDADGDVDLASANSFSDNVGVVRGDGAGGLAGLATYPAGSFPLAVDLGDLDADGDLDLVLSSYNSADWTVYTNDGSGGFHSPQTFDADQAGSCMTIVDYDRDGDMDMVGIDELTDRVFLFRQRSTPPPGVEAGACGAQLRVDNLAGWAGFGAQPAHVLTPGRPVFFSITGAPFQPAVFGFGLPKQPGVPVTSGLLNVGLITPLVLAPADAAGESSLEVVVPPGLPPGLPIAIQAWVAGQLTNAEIVRT